MGISEKVFIDSNYFISLYNREDSRYGHALEISKKLDGGEDSFFISNFVFAEIVTVLSQRVGKKTALHAGKYLLSRRDLQVLHIDESLQASSWDMFQQIEQKNISFVDCSIIAAMKAENISMLLTFDRTDFATLQKQYRFSLYKDLV